MFRNMKVFEKKIIFLILLITNIIAAPYPRYKRSDDSPQDDNSKTGAQDQQKTSFQKLIDTETSTDKLSSTKHQTNSYNKLSTTTDYTTTKNDHNTTSEDRSPTTNGKSGPVSTNNDHNSNVRLNQNTIKQEKQENVSKNIEILPPGLEISGVENRFSCLLKLPNGKRVCKPLSYFILLSKNSFDCQDRNIEIAFRGYTNELEDTDEFISSFLNREPGEIEGTQIRESTCLFYKK
jgi:hypothetical protein